MKQHLGNDMQMRLKYRGTGFKGRHDDDAFTAYSSQDIFTRRN